MKDIKDMSLSECLEALREGMPVDGTVVRVRLSDDDLAQLADRIYDLTRWIPVEERLPCTDDGLRVHVKDTSGLVFTVTPGDLNFFGAVSWKRTDP
jgi:hypothetical protein